MISEITEVVIVLAESGVFEIRYSGKILQLKASSDASRDEWVFKINSRLSQLKTTDGKSSRVGGIGSAGSVKLDDAVFGEKTDGKIKLTGNSEKVKDTVQLEEFDASSLDEKAGDVIKFKGNSKKIKLAVAEFIW